MRSVEVRRPALERVRCKVCTRYCLLDCGETGPCGIMRSGPNGLTALGAGRIARTESAPIESMGFYHVLPGSQVLCAAPGEGLPAVHPWATGPEEFAATPSLRPARSFVCTASELAERARFQRCRSVLFTRVEPTYYLETLLEALSVNRRSGIVGLVQTNGCMSRESVNQIGPLLDGASLLVPTLREESAARLSTVPPHLIRGNLRRLWLHGVWVEVTTVLVPGFNDSRAELLEIALSLRDLHPSIPWHLRLAGDRPLLEGLSRQQRCASLARALAAAERAGLENVYAAGAAGRDRELTFCHVCLDQVLVERFHGRASCFLREGSRCPCCQAEANGLFAC